jgi:hypothetical protein
VSDGNLTIGSDLFFPIKVELEDALPSTFEISFPEQLPLEVNFGIPGPKGDKGDVGDLSNASIGQLNDVELVNPTSGDTFIYENGAFRNTPMTNITDGGNF